jgi:hypothetical protein
VGQGPDENGGGGCRGRYRDHRLGGGELEFLEEHCFFSFVFLIFFFFMFGCDFLETILENGVVAGGFCSRSV